MAPVYPTHRRRCTAPAPSRRKERAIAAGLPAEDATASRLSADFWKYWIGQTISNFGSAITIFVLPLLVYQLTGSALNLAISTAANLLPYLLFGLLIGAWVDRVDRRAVMIGADLARCAIIALVPLLFTLGALTVWWIYAVGFLSSTVTIAFDSAEFAAIPSLVATDDLVTANGRLQASYSAGRVAGPLLGGVLVAVIAIPDLLLADAASFLVSALSLLLIRTRFNVAPTGSEPREPLFRTIVAGLRYVRGHPVLRNISLMMALINFFGTTRGAQLVLFASVRLGADQSRVGYLYAAGGLGVVLLSLLAGLLRRRWSFSVVALGALLLQGLLTVVLSFTTIYWLALPIWALTSGLGVLFNINSGSLRQATVPNELLGRVISIASVLAWSAIPLGAMAGGTAIEWTGNVALVYGVIGAVTSLIAIGFAFTALGHADDYVPTPAAAD